MDVTKFELLGETIQIKDKIARDNISILNERVTNNETSIQTNENDISTLKHTIGNYDLSNVVMIGDSYLNGGGSTNPLTDNWGDLLSIYLEINNYRKYPNGGGGFIVKGALDQNFISMVSPGGYVYNNEQNKNNVKTVIVMGGINDGEVSGDTMRATVSSFIEALRNCFPNAKPLIIYNFTPVPMYYPHIYGICKACADYGLDTPQNSFWWLWNGNDIFNSDNIHPNTLGYKRGTQILASWIRGYEFIPPTSGKITEKGLNWVIRFIDGKCSIFVSGTLSDTTNVLVATLPKSLKTTNDINLVSGVGTPFSGLTLKSSGIVNGININTGTFVSYNAFEFSVYCLLKRMFNIYN
jgi:lysophospholipase L1-like esterase